MSNPGAVVAVARLTVLVGTDFFHGFVVGLRIALDGDLGGHAADGVDAAAMGGLDGKQGIGVHAVGRHGDQGAIRHGELRMMAELFDDACKM